MEIIRRLFWVLVVFNLMGCDPAKKGLTARDTPPPKPSPIDEKPDPIVIDKAENFKVLSFQDPTSDVDKFSNIMSLDLQTNKQAWFSFTYTPRKDGFLYFSVKSVNFKMECTGEQPTKFKAGVYWQEYTKDSRKIISVLESSNASFEFKNGKNYILTYALTDLKKDLPNCRTGTLRFAVFGGE